MPQARHVGCHRLQMGSQVWRPQISEVWRLEYLEEENNKLKKLLAEQMPDNAGLKGNLAKGF